MPVISQRPAENLFTEQPPSTESTAANTAVAARPAEHEAPTSSWMELIKASPGYKAESQLAAAYAAALVDAADDESANKYDNPVLPVPPDSKFGQWRQHLDDLLAGPDFQQWADFNKIDRSKPIRISPQVGGPQEHITVTLKPRSHHDPAELEMFSPGQGKRLPDSWRLIMQAASTLAPGRSSVMVPPPGRSSPTAHAERPATLSEIATFYGEPFPDTREGAINRANELKQAGAFPMPDTSLSSAQLESGSEDMLERQQKTLGDIHNKNRLFQQLSKALKSLPPAPEPADTQPYFIAEPQTPEAAERIEKAKVKEFLQRNHVQIDPSSWYFQDAQLMPEDKVSIEQFIADTGRKIPETKDEIKILIEHLKYDVLPTSPNGNFTGALGWAEPLSLYEQRQVYSHVLYNNLQLPGLDGSQSSDKKAGAFNYLTKNLHFTSQQLQYPRYVLSEILASPKAKELEAALQKKMGAAEDKESSDWVLAAMLLGLGSPSWLKPANRNEVAEYDLADKAFYGRPLQNIRQGLQEHLISTGRTTPDLAPTAAYLLLSRAAPELLVKDIPSYVTYGSPSWFSLKSTVALIEAKSPGSSAEMTFNQVASYGSLEQINDEDEQLLNEVKQDALIDWALMYGVLPASTTRTYSAQQLSAAQSTFSGVMGGLTTISADLSAPLPRLKDKALELMGKHFKNVDLTAKVITRGADKTSNALNSAPWDVTYGPYSLLDLSLSQNLKNLKDNKEWYSFNQQKVPTGAIQSLSILPDIKHIHKTELADFDRRRTSSLTNLTKHLIAQLPLADRQQLEYGNLEILRKRPIEKFTATGIASYTSTSYPAPQKSNIEDPLLIKATHQGRTITYEFNPAKNYIRPSPVNAGLQGEWEEKNKNSVTGFTYKNVIVEPLVDDQIRARDLQARVSDEASIPYSYNSERSQFLSNLITRYSYQDCDLNVLTAAAHHTTKFDEENGEHEANIDTLLGTIPFANGIRKAIQGDWQEATVGLVFDGVMLLAPGLPKTVRGLSSVPSRLRSTRAFGSQLFKSASNISSYTPNGPFKNLARARTGRYELSKFASRPDIAEGTYKKGSATLSAPAKLDNKTGKWHAFDPVKNRSYGKPLENYTPHAHIDDALPGTSGGGRTSRARALDRELGRDNVIQLGGKMKDLKLIGNEIHTFVDEYKNLKRLNIVAHGTERDWVDNFFGSGTKVLIDNKLYSAKDLIKLLRTRGVDPASFDSIRLLVCHSAEGKSRAFGRLFQKEIGKPVKAFEGTVTVDPGSTFVTTKRNLERKNFALSNTGADAKTLDFLADNEIKKKFVNKITVGVKKNHGATIKVNIAEVNQPPVIVNGVVNYQPRWFTR
ncbi:hypothetical protein C4J98_2342 [Pseudomonas orientalis]|uniref:hypothetical protein n=1 Tax=Pseudomonas orientalis TaxID=76758 RepID=UPI000F56E653|nr:hypothetical protein [Pseudomonas orientalis]AZE83755.1 hypothetical protein C4J98_2342 [Pseudomonas orientalis]